MREEFNKVTKKVIKKEQPFNFIKPENRKKYVEPFLVYTEQEEQEEDATMITASAIAWILSCKEDFMLKMMRSDNARASEYTRMIRNARKAIKEGKISENAPWLEALKTKMLSLEIFAASVETEMDIKQGRLDEEANIETMLGALRKLKVASPKPKQEGPDKK